MKSQFALYVALTGKHWLTWGYSHTWAFLGIGVLFLGPIKLLITWPVKDDDTSPSA